MRSPSPRLHPEGKHQERAGHSAGARREVCNGAGPAGSTQITQRKQPGASSVPGEGLHPEWDRLPGSSNTPHTHTPPILASKGMKGQRAEGKMLCFGGGVTKCPATGPLPPLHSKRAAWFPRSQAFLLVEGEVNISSCETVSNRQTAPSVTNGLCFKKYLGLERQLSS